MSQVYKRDKNVNLFDEYIIQQVWEKGKIIERNSPATWREDSYGYFMKREFYGKKNSRYGWEIDHIKPLTAGGDDNLENLQPVQWQNKVRRERTYGDK